MKGSFFESFYSKEVITLPRDLKTDVEGFTFFAKLLDRTRQKKHFIFDFEQVNWLDANLCALLSAIIHHNRRYGAVFSHHPKMNDQHRWTLNNIGLLALLKNIEHLEKNSSAIPLKEFDMVNESEVEEYIYRYILKSDLVPQMSPGAKRKVFRSIFEIYQNSVMHSGASHIYVCGQYFKHKKRMALTMVEIGRTFKENVTSHDQKYSHFTGKQSIEWAVERGNTTKIESETGGLGLDLIREFLRLNQGKLQILSADGYWEEKKGVNFAVDCNTSFQGSVVNIEFNLRDSNRYSTPEELDIKSIL